MTTMVVTKIPPVLQGDFDPIRLSVDNLIKVSPAIPYAILLRTKRFCFSALFYSLHISVSIYTITEGSNARRFAEREYNQVTFVRRVPSRNP